MTRRKDLTKEMISQIKFLHSSFTYPEIAELINQKYGTNFTANAIKKSYQRYEVEPKPTISLQPPKILCLDIETTPLVVYTWDIGQVYLTIDQIIEDWSILSFSAKWAGSKQVIYEDTQGKKNKRDDKDLCVSLKKLLDEADIVVTHNGKRFDIPRINARLFHHKIQEPSSFRHIDTCSISKRKFKFTSNKLAYLTAKFTEHEKLKHSKFPGLSLWKACLEGNASAFTEMKKYNKMDTVVLEEIYELLLSWDNKINFTIYGDKSLCSCGNDTFKESGFHYTNGSVFKKFKCTKCNKEYRDSKAIKSAKFRPLS